MHTLSITEQGTQLSAEGNLLVLTRGKAVLSRTRAAQIEQVLLFGRIELTSGAVALLSRRGIDCAWLRQDGRFRARLLARRSANLPLRLAHYRAATDPAFCLRVARGIVAAKVHYQRAVLLRAQRRLADDALAVVLGQMRLLGHQVERATSLERLLGLEGQGAALYFGQFGKLLRVPHFSFTVRNRRPPRDEVNACLSFGYAVLGSIIESQVERRGLDPLLGFFHQPLYGRPSLALDLLEEFRPFVDGLVLRLVNRRQLGPNDFERRSSPGIDDLLAADSFVDNRVCALPSAADQDGDGSPGETPGRADFDDFDDFSAWPPMEASQGDDDVFADWPIAGASAGSGGSQPFPLDLPSRDGILPVDAQSKISAEPQATLQPTNRPGPPTIGVYLGDAGRRIFLSELFRRLRERVYYPPRAAAWEVREIIGQQVYHLARVIEGRDAGYIPFVPAGN